VITFRGSDLNPDPALSRSYSFAQHAMSRLATIRAGRVICVSEQLKDRLVFSRRRTVVIPTGVDTTIFRPMPWAAARAQLGWSEDDHVVLFNEGAAPRTKGSALAAAAVAEAEHKIGKIRYEVMRGGYSAEQVCVRMNAADCLIMASKWEGSPTVVEEAIACNLPVISTEVGDVRERLREVVPSAIVPPDPYVFGTKIAEVLQQRKRSNGQDLVGNISQDAIAEKLIEIYTELAMSKPQAAVTKLS
jgi:glycosyltransferase involved in cell wall biosynthesis